MTTQVIDYDITQAALADLRKRLLIKFDANTKDGYEHARKGIAECRSLRVAVEKKRKELKADALEYGRKVDAVAKELTASLEQIEKPLQDAKDAVDAERDRVKREAEEKARMEREAKEQAEREAREAELRAERERLAAEREKLEAERREMEAQQRALQIEQAKREAAERAAREERERIERERLAAEEAERKRQEDEAKRLAERPDWVKAREWAESVAATAATWAGLGIASQDARDATANAWAEIHDVVETLIAFAKRKA